jgi:hypothetical protein
MVCVLALIAGGAIALAATGSGEKSQANTHVRELAGRGRVALVPSHHVGMGGWCLAYLHSNDQESESGDCGAHQSIRGPLQGPIIAESAPRVAVKKAGGQWVTTVIALARAQVAAVSFEGYARIVTHANASLPDHLRGAIIELRSQASKQRLPHFPSGHLIAWNTTGARIPLAFTLGAPLGFQVPSRSWSFGKREPRGVCALKLHGFTRDTFRNGGVMTAVKPHANVRGREFVNCAHSYYLLDAAWPIEANILLDAEHPGSTPAPLPGMRPLEGRPGIVIGPEPENGEVARRVPGAWLVVAKGADLSQRLTLLKHLVATVHP